MQASEPAAQVLTTRPDGSWPGWLDAIGPVTDLHYESGLMSCVLRVPAFTSRVVNPGSIAKVMKAGACVWQGTLGEPVPTAEGWQIQAHAIA